MTTVATGTIDIATDGITIEREGGEEGVASRSGRPRRSWTRKRMGTRISSPAARKTTPVSRTRRRRVLTSHSKRVTSWGTTSTTSSSALVAARLERCSPAGMWFVGQEKRKQSLQRTRRRMALPPPPPPTTLPPLPPQSLLLLFLLLLLYSCHLHYLLLL